MNGPYAEWNKSHRENQIFYLCGIYKTEQMKELATKQQQTPRYREHTGSLQKAG